MKVSEAPRDLVRAREAAKQDQMRARHRLSKFLLRSGQRPPTGVRPWTRPYLIWVAQLRFTQIAQEATRQDYLHEVEHMRERVTTFLNKPLTIRRKARLTRIAAGLRRTASCGRKHDAQRMGPAIS